MPTYEYVCDACNHRFELFQAMTEPARRKCPACARLKVRRLIGMGAAVLFRGSGFYQTDHRSPDYQRQAKAERDGSRAKESPSSPAKEASSPPSGASGSKESGEGE